MNRNTIRLDRWVLEPVMDFNEIRSASFTCGDDEIDDFFINDSERHLKDRMAVTYMMHPYDDKFIVALASLQNDAVKLKRGHKFLAGYPYKSLTAVKIGRLGVRVGLQKSGVGSSLLNLVNHLMQTDNRTGCRLVTVDAYLEAVPFYQKNGFEISENIKNSAGKKSRHSIPMYALLGV